MTTTRSAPITHSAVDENVHSYMARTSLLVSSKLDARGGAKVYKTHLCHVRVFRVKMRLTVRFRTPFGDRSQNRTARTIDARGAKGSHKLTAWQCRDE